MQNKIVAISDTHLGQAGMDSMGQYSLLSTRVEGNLVQKFKEAVARFAAGDKVSLVVVGDFLDLSLSYMEDALVDMRELLAEVKVDEITYLIGNHDIEMWSLHCEEKNLLGSLRLGKVPSADASLPGGKGLYKVTSKNGEPFTLLQPLIDRIYEPRKVPITIAYPSYTVEATDGALIYFTHGHLFGGIYTQISDILQEDLAARSHERVAATVNQPLIGLIYWLLGEVGEGLGVDGLVERVYTDLQKGKGNETEELVNHAAEKLFANDVLRWALVKWAMHKLKKRLSSSSDVAASADRHAELEKTREELRRWVDDVHLLENGNLGHPVHVVTGHTHVPDQYLYLHEDRPHQERPITSWNLGSWLVEPKHDLPRTGFLGIERDGRVAWVDVK